MAIFLLEVTVQYFLMTLLESTDTDKRFHKIHGEIDKITHPALSHIQVAPSQSYITICSFSCYSTIVEFKIECI